MPRSASASASPASSAASMEDDALAQIIHQGLKEQNKIEALIDKLYDSDASSLSKSRSESPSEKTKRVGKKTKEDNRQIKIQYRISEQVRLYTENTAVRAMKYMRELADPHTMLLKSYVQHLIYTGGNPIDPVQFCMGIENPRLATPEHYYHWTVQDNFGVYFMALMMVYGTYRGALGQVGQLRPFLVSLMEHVIPMMNNGTGFFQDYLQFIESIKETLELVGIPAAELHTALLNKMVSEWEALFNIITQLPVNISVAGTHRRLFFQDVISEVPTYIRHMEAFAQIDHEVIAVTNGVRAAIGLPAGGMHGGASRSKVRFVFRPLKIFSSPKKSSSRK